MDFELSVAGVVFVFVVVIVAIISSSPHSAADSHVGRHLHVLLVRFEDGEAWLAVVGCCLARVRSEALGLGPS